MRACRVALCSGQIDSIFWALLTLLASTSTAEGAIFRHSTFGSHAVTSASGHAGAKTDVKAKDAKKAEEARHRLAGLVDISADLEVDEKKDDSDLKQIESQIVKLVHKRDAAKRDEARKMRELAFLHMEIGRARANAGEGTAVATEVTQESEQEVKADMSVDAAIASADQVVKQAEASVSSVQQSAEQALAARESKIRAEAQAAAEASQARAAREAKIRAEAEAAAEAKLRAEAEEKRRRAEAEAAAEARLRAEAEEKARQKLAAEEAAKRQAEEAQRAKESAKLAAQRQAEEDARKKRDALADSADDSFKQFMKEEDGEDQMGDADYEDSANALAGAIGWNRQEIEHKADSAVKSLTEAIGGRKVVQSLQGMMAGIHAQQR